MQDATHRMSQSFAIFPTPLAVWSRRLALFAAQLVILGIVLHRAVSLPTPVALNLFLAAMGCAVLAIVVGLGAGIVIWRQGRSGAWSAAGGIGIGLVILAWPAVLAAIAWRLPQVNDITTDTAQPPAFTELAKLRPVGANPVGYAGQAPASLQREFYPEIRPIQVARPLADAFDIVADTVRRQRWSVVVQEPPAGTGRPGRIEAVDRTLVIGFHDDIVVRVTGDARQTRVDVRSASRYGRHDLGRNAIRVRRLLAELNTQLDPTVPGIERRRKPRPGLAVPKRPKDGPVASSARPRAPGPAQPDAQRARPQKAKPRPRGEARGRDRRPAQSQQ